MNSVIQEIISSDSLFIFSAFLINFSTGLLILSRDPKSLRNFSFFLLSLNVSWWLFFYGLFRMSGNAQDALLWLRMAHTLSIPFVSPSLYFFSLAWNGDAHKKKRRIQLGYALAGVVALTHTFFTEKIYAITSQPWGTFIQLQRTPFAISYYILFLSLFGTYVVLSLINFLKEYRRSTVPKVRKQIATFICSILVGYTGSMDFLTVMGFNVPPLGYISATAFMMIIAYGILRYQLLGINLIIKRVSLIFLIYSLLFAFLSPIALPLIRNMLDRPAGASVQLIFLLSAGVGLVLSTGPLIYTYLVKNSFWIKTQQSTGLAHELKSPLGNILLTSDLLLNDVSKIARDPAKLADYLKVIQRNAERMEIFVGNLLKIAKIQDGDFSLQKEVFNLSQEALKEVEHYTPVFAARGLQFEIQITPDIQFEGDSEKLRQVISNLLSNAAKFTSAGTISLDLERNEKEIICNVADQGQGVSSDEIEKIFGRFYQGKNVNKGSGIGLTIAKAWVEAHGGKIWAESEGEGKGTKVTFTLPV